MLDLLAVLDFRSDNDAHRPMFLPHVDPYSRLDLDMRARTTALG